MYYLKSSVVSSKHNDTNYVYAKGDSAASDHYFREEDTDCLENIIETIGKSITLPDGSQIQANRKGLLLTSTSLSTQTREAKILPNLKSASLISIGKLCDDGCKVNFDEHGMDVIKNNKVIMHGTRNKRDGLYDIPIQKTTLQSNNYIIQIYLL